MKIMIKRAVGSLALVTLLGGVVGTSPAAAVETGQLLDKGPRWPHKGTVKIGSAECPGSTCTPEVIDQAVQRDQITPKEAKALRKIQDQLCGLPYTPPCRTDAPATDVETGQLLIKDRPVARVNGKPNPRAAGGGNPGWIIPSLSVIAVAGGVLAVTSGKSKPASPN